MSCSRAGSEGWRRRPGGLRWCPRRRLCNCRPWLAAVAQAACGLGDCPPPEHERGLGRAERERPQLLERARVACQARVPFQADPAGRAEHHHLPDRLPRRMRPPRRNAPVRRGIQLVRALERQPRRPPRLGPATAERQTPSRNTATGVAASNRHARLWRVLPQDFRVLTPRCGKYAGCLRFVMSQSGLEVDRLDIRGL